jgi:hypothetical protein
MHSRAWLIGCILCLVGIGTVSATGLRTGNLESSSNSSRSESASSRTSRSGGDALAPGRDMPSQDSEDVSRPSPNDDSTRSDIPSSGHTHTRPSRLGWQSLLPGSIQ